MAARRILSLEAKRKYRDSFRFKNHRFPLYDFLVREREKKKTPIPSGTNRNVNRSRAVYSTQPSGTQTMTDRLRIGERDTMTKKEEYTILRLASMTVSMLLVYFRG